VRPVNDRPHGAHPHVPQAPRLWIEQCGRQYRVYWRNSDAGLPARSHVPFYGRAEAVRFVGMAGLLGLDTARQVLDTEDTHAAAALLQAALAERGLAAPTPAPETLPTAPAGPRGACPATARAPPHREPACAASEPPAYS
jgi:hypothetical protein